MKAWLEQADEHMTGLTEALAMTELQLSQRLTQLRTDLDSKIVREMERVELNCSSSMGKMISAGIEQLEASSKATGILDLALGLNLNDLLLHQVGMYVPSFHCMIRDMRSVEFQSNEELYLKNDMAYMPERITAGFPTCLACFSCILQERSCMQLWES